MNATSRATHGKARGTSGKRLTTAVMWGLRSGDSKNCGSSVTHRIRTASRGER